MFTLSSHENAISMREEERSWVKYRSNGLNIGKTFESGLR